MIHGALLFRAVHLYQKSNKTNKCALGFERKYDN